VTAGRALTAVALPLVVVLTVVGSVNLDLVARVPRLPAAGQTLTATGFDRVPGGKGANQALAASRLGAQVRLVAAVGAAEASETGEALALLRAGGVALDRVRPVPGTTTGLALIQVDGAGDTTIVVIPGANAALRVDAADVAGAEAVLAVLEVPVAAVEAAAEHAAPGAFFALNAAPAQPVPRRLLERADLVVVNRDEYAALGNTALGDGHAARCVAVTHGAAGAVLLRGGVEVARAQPPPVRALDGTAAGDAFTAALVLALLAGLDDARALRRACAAGALAASRPGAQPSLPTAAEVDGILAR
jgi:ribokinase